jgi:glycosyltransferase involved in cell wall biosynthesis
VAQLAETLVAAGHEVTVLLARWYPPDDGTFDSWIAHYRRKGIVLHVLECKPAVRFHGPLHVIANREVYEWLKAADPFDVVHFNDFEGMGHYTLLAKHQGLGFQATTLCVTVHSPHFYLKQANQQYITSVTDMELDFVERRSVELADVVISPSQYMIDWMRAQEWVLPAQCYVQQSLVPLAGTVQRAPSSQPHPVKEIVFFGVLQELKGIALFCDAIEALPVESHAGLRITFLGKDGVIDEMSCRDYIHRRAATWTLPVSVVTDLGQEDALAYLAGPGRLAVMASRLDNSPYVVMECIANGIPFLASRVGGIPELVHPDDVARVCYDRSPSVLTALLVRVLRDGMSPARHRVAPADRLASWLAFHQTIPALSGRRSVLSRPDPATLPLVTMCITHFNRAALLEQAVASVAAQDYPNLELVIVDDGSTDPAALAGLTAIEARAAREQRPWRVVRQENRYLGAARNNGVRHARGEFVAFLDDDDVAKPHRISTQVTAALHTNADIVLAGMDEFTGMDAPVDGQVPIGTWISLGPCVAVGTLQNCFGAVHAMVRRSSFLELGGFREVVRVGHEDWEYWARAVHAGQRLEMVPEALNWYRLTPGSMLKTTAPYQNDMVSLQPHLDAVPQGLRPLVQMAFGTFRQNVSLEAERRAQRAGIARKVIIGARLLSARLHDQAVVYLLDAVRDATAVQDLSICFDTLCDVGTLLAGIPAHHDSGLTLLAEAARMAAVAKYAKGIETADVLMRAMQAIEVSPRAAGAALTPPSMQSRMRSHATR